MTTKQPSTSPDSPAEAAPEGADPGNAPEPEAAGAAEPAQELEAGTIEAIDEQDDQDEQDDGPLDLASRELCPDGVCIGIIGPDGRCKVCGAKRPGGANSSRRSEVGAAGEPSSGGTAADPAEDADRGSASEKDDFDREAHDLDEGDPAPPDFTNRTLCSDGACIGVIDLDGRCKVCSKPYTGPPED